MGGLYFSVRPVHAARSDAVVLRRDLAFQRIGGPMTDALPALSLVAVPGRRRTTLDIAREAERRGFSGVYVPSIFGNMAQCTALALATERLTLATAIAPIYARTV